jgi:hypothetical protein
LGGLACWIGIKVRAAFAERSGLLRPLRDRR